jgi:hypothetical protein
MRRRRCARCRCRRCHRVLLAVAHRHDRRPAGPSWQGRRLPVGCGWPLGEWVATAAATATVRAQRSAVQCSAVQCSAAQCTSSAQEQRNGRLETSLLQARRCLSCFLRARVTVCAAPCRPGHTLCQARRSTVKARCVRPQQSGAIGAPYLPAASQRAIRRRAVPLCRSDSQRRLDAQSALRCCSAHSLPALLPLSDTVADRWLRQQHASHRSLTAAALHGAAARPRRRPAHTVCHSPRCLTPRPGSDELERRARADARPTWPSDGLRRAVPAQPPVRAHQPRRGVPGRAGAGGRDPCDGTLSKGIAHALGAAG